jgi:signal transduction histidine kinase
VGLEKQNRQLEELNQQFGRREAALQTLLAATRWDADHGSGNQVISKIAAAVIPLMGGDVSASAVVQRDGHWLRAIGYSGFATDALEQTAWPLKNSFALSVMERGQTDFIENLSKRPEVIAPMAAGQPSIRSMISTPLRLGGQINGAIEAYSRTERKWTAEDIKIMEWLAAQTSLAMEIVLLQRELEQRRRDAVGESVRKTRFLVAISHDVRTPANAINLLSELMVRSSEDPEKAGDMRRLALEMRQSADALTELIGDVLDVSSFDSGQVQLDVLEFPLDALLDREVARLRPLAEIKSLDLRCQLAGESVWLRTDRTKLSRVVTNLIANAIKFTPSGHVEVKRQARPDGAIEIHVTDTGVGIAQDKLERIQRAIALKGPAWGWQLVNVWQRRWVANSGCAASQEKVLHSPLRFRRAW